MPEASAARIAASWDFLGKDRRKYPKPPLLLFEFRCGDDSSGFWEGFPDEDFLAGGFDRGEDIFDLQEKGTREEFLPPD
jgi:hypothetical protein